jgi:hypothetical protein
VGETGVPSRDKIRCVAPTRFVLLATICAAIMCCAGAVQLVGINRLVVTDGRIGASPATSPSGAVDVHFKSDTFPLER